MGIEILSFTIKDIYDNEHYLDSLGKTQTAEVKKNADVGVAEANRDAGIRVRVIKRVRPWVILLSTEFHIKSHVSSGFEGVTTGYV